MKELKISKKTKKGLQITAVILVIIFILAFIYHLRSIFNPVLLSLLIAYILNPIVNFFEKIKVRRTLSIFFIYIVLTAIIVLLFILIIPLISQELSYLYEKTFIGDTFKDLNKNNKWEKGEPLIEDIDGNGKYDPSYIEIFTKWLKKNIEKWNEKYPNQRLEWEFIVNQLANKEGIKTVGKTIFAVSKGTIIATLSTLLNLFSITSYFILLPLYTFFLLKSLNEIRDTIYDYLPGYHKEEIIRILQRIHKAVSCFFRGKLIICIIKGFLTWGLLELLGIKYALIFGGIQTVASIVPFLVLVVGMIPNIILFLLDKGLVWPYIIGIIAIYGAIECLEGFVLTPWVMGQETGLHPLTVILSLLIGGKLFGLFGLIIAIPLCTTLKILGEEFILPAWKEVFQCEISDKSKKKQKSKDLSKKPKKSK